MIESDIDAKETHAFFEQVTIPPGHSFLWRLDDYPWARNVWNYHPEFEIHLIRHSSGITYVGDFIGQFEAGQLFLVGSDLPHNWITPDIGSQLLKGRDIVLQFDPHIFSSASLSFPELAGAEELFAKARLGVEFVGETARDARDIIESMDGSGSISDLAKMLNLLSILAGSAETRTLASEAFLLSEYIKKDSDHVLIEKALIYLHANFLANPSLKDVAEIVDMSESAFSRFFKNKTGNTFSHHIMSLRLWMAGKLLLETDEPITNICFEAGFNNISNFNRMFLRYNGLTPTEYRKTARQRNFSQLQERDLKTGATTRRSEALED